MESTGMDPRVSSTSPGQVSLCSYRRRVGAPSNWAVTVRMGCCVGRGPVLSADAALILMTMAVRSAALTITACILTT